MVKLGVPESAILASIQAGPCRFDLSPDALIAMHKEGIPPRILEAMVSSGADQSNPANQNAGAPPPDQKRATFTAEQSKALLARMRSKKGHLGPVVSNTKGDNSDADIIAALKQQKQASDSSQGTTPAGMSLGNSNPTGGTGNNPAGTPGANPTGTAGITPGSVGSGGSTGKKVIAGSAPTQATAPASSLVVMRAAQPMIGAAAPSPSSSSNTVGLSRNISVSPCAISGNGPVITGLAGERIGLSSFSQDPSYNPFTISGCHFGSSTGSAYLANAAGQKISDLTINNGGWSDSQIKVTVNPSLVDVFDQDNVTLVIVPVGGHPGQKSGFKFYAMRREVPLAVVPHSQATLAQVVDSAGTNLGAYFSSPYQGLGYSTQVQTGVTRAVADAEVQSADKGMTLGVDRNDVSRFSGGTDVFDFSALKPGFYVTRFQIDERNIDVCLPGAGFDISIPNTTEYQDGSWLAQIIPGQGQIRVDWAEEHCHMSAGGSDSSNSSYALNVWVKGPAISANASPWRDGLK